LPEIAFKGMVDLLIAQHDLGNPVVGGPFLCWEKKEQKIQHLLIPDIKKMSASDVERLPVYDLAAAQSARRSGGLQKPDLVLSDAAL